MSWDKVACAERDKMFTALSGSLCVIAGRSDMSGEYGDPRIETIWGDNETEGEVLKDVRHPRYEWDSQEGDRKPCEHYQWVTS